MCIRDRSQTPALLPAALAGRYHIVQPLPTAGEGVDVLLVETADGQRAVARVYPYGIRPRDEVVQQMSAAAPCYVVRLLEQGEVNGQCYEPVSYTHLDVYKRQRYAGAGAALPGCRSALY